MGKTLSITLKYGQNRERSIAGVRRISKPGLRVYAKSNALPVLGGLGIAIISTSQGLLTDGQAHAPAWVAKSSPTSGEARDEKVGRGHVTHWPTPGPVPSGVEVTLDGQQVLVKGPKGTLQHRIADPIRINRADSGELEVTRPDDERVVMLRS